MTAVTWRASTIVVDETSAREITDRLADLLDASEHAVAAFGRSDGRWDVTIHFSGDERDDIRKAVREAAGEAVFQALTFEEIADADWVSESLQGLAPVAAGRFVVHGRHDRQRIAANKISIEVEAALAFGTGHHGTTRGCLLLLDGLLKQTMPLRVFDLGTGTGVLAIAAAKALRRHVLASDIDPMSVSIANANARLNSVGDLVTTIRADGFAAPAVAAQRPFDLILANVLANPLRQMATAMVEHLAPSGALILSGLLHHQAQAVITTYRGRGVRLERHLKLAGWSSLLLVKPQR